MPALPKLGRGEVDRDSPRGVLVAAVPNGATNALSGFLKGGVRETNDREPGQTGRNVHLDTNRPSVQSVERGREKRCEHRPR